jgi:hypothetical protein
MDISGRELECRTAEISAYIDGELGPKEEQRLEMHVRECQFCLDELNLQKRFLAALEGPVGDESAQIELPPDFAKSVAVRAESSVTGVRHRSEFLMAVAITVGLLAFVVASLSGDARPFGIGESLIEKSGAALGFVSHTLVDIARGTGFVFRTLISQYISGPALLFALFTVFFAGCLVGGSRLLLRGSRSGGLR